eukprot:2247862-Pyramimonas_sp.AAC.1
MGSGVAVMCEQGELLRCTQALPATFSSSARSCLEKSSLMSSSSHSSSHSCMSTGSSSFVVHSAYYMHGFESWLSFGIRHA